MTRTSQVPAPATVDAPSHEDGANGPLSITPHQARYYALDLARRAHAHDVSAVGAGLFDAQVDLNPHQIEAALFGIRTSADSGRLLADEVGLGKTIEAALVLSQLWAERRRRLLVVAPAALRRQWVDELQKKFGLPARLVDQKSAGKDGKQSMSLQSKPVALNEGEWLLVTHLKALVERARYLDGVDVWLLRNPPRHGLGFRDIRGAFPDFILWLVRGDEQWFSFIDPHGIRMVTDPATEPKLHLWKTLSEIERRHPDLGVHLNAWILSVTPEHEVSPLLRPFLDHHIVFQDNEGKYLEVVMKRLLGVGDGAEETRS